jgi:hypothetical protein
MLKTGLQTTVAYFHFLRVERQAGSSGKRAGRIAFMN